MLVSVVTVEIFLPEARSLKDKRRIVKSLKDKIYSRFRVSIAETRNHDLRQISELGIAAVAPDPGHLEELMASIRVIFERRHDLIVTSWRERIVEGEV